MNRFKQTTDRDVALAMCPNAANHTKGPEGYLAWHVWADKMRRTHNQSPCPGCGLLLIVTPKKEAGNA